MAYHKLAKDNLFYAMSKENEPKLTVELGDTVDIETHDCFTGQITSEEGSFGGLDWERINPATGPVYVDGIKAGDVLKVTVNSIDISDTGVMVTGPGMGVMGDTLKETLVRVYDVNTENNTVNFNGLPLPVNKMIGVIGVAPPDEAVNNGTPDTHGGNMDCLKITEGITLYLPVYHDGALFGLGDVHAAMADGEVSVSGLEVSSNVNVTFEKAKNLQTEHPVIINDEGIYLNVSDESLDTAVDTSVHKMAELLQPKTDLSKEEFTMLMSLAGHAQINQVVDPKKTVRYFMPQYILDHYGIKFN